MGREDAGEHNNRRHRGRKKKLDPQGIFELLGIALGCIHLSYDEFCKLDFNEFAAVYKAWAVQRDTDFKNQWNQFRTLACITIQPHIDKKHKITPEKLLPFPWDHVKEEVKAVTMTKEEQRARMVELAKKLGNKI